MFPTVLFVNAFTRKFSVKSNEHHPRNIHTEKKITKKEKNSKIQLLDIDMEVYIKELICSSILGLKLQKFKKRSFRLRCYRNSSKVLCSLEKKEKKKKKERKKERKYSE